MLHNQLLIWNELTQADGDNGQTITVNINAIIIAIALEVNLDQDPTVRRKSVWVYKTWGLVFDFDHLVFDW